MGANQPVHNHFTCACMYVCIPLVFPQVQLQRQLEDARAAVEAQEQRIQRLQGELAPRGRPSHWEGRATREREPAEGRMAGGRWTAHRAGVRKVHVGPVVYIIDVHTCTGACTYMYVHLLCIQYIISLYNIYM